MKKYVYIYIYIYIYIYQLVEMHNPKQQRHVHMKPTSKHKKMQINKQKIEKKAKQLRPTEIRNKT